MSLINEALKKAQRQRMEDPVAVPAPAATTAAPAPRIAKRRPPMPASTLILLLGGGGAVVVMAGVFAYLFLLPDAPPPAPIKSHVAAAPVSPVAPAPAPTPAPVAPAPAPVEVAITLPPITPPATKPVAPPVAPPVQASTVVLTPPPAAPKPTPAIAATPTANPKVYEFLETLRIAGIRVSATDPKVIMNDRVFRLNDLVDRNTQLRLLKVEAATLIFVDPSGYEYRKNF